MPTVEEVARAVQKDFSTLDANKDGNIDYKEFKALKVPELTNEERKAIFQELVLASSDEEGPETVITPADLKKSLLSKANRTYDDAAIRLEKIFGQKVTVSEIRDFNGVPSFEIKAGKNMADADKVIDKLIEAREAAGLRKADLPFRAREDGTITIYAGDLLDYEKPTDPKVKETKFKAFEKKEIMEMCKAAFGSKKD